MYMKKNLSNNHGGARAGSGAKLKDRTVSDKIKGKILKAAKELEKEFGESLEKAMLRLVYITSTSDTVKATVFRAYLESLVARESKSETTISDNRPAIYLPEKKEDPALKVVRM